MTTSALSNSSLQRQENAASFGVRTNLDLGLGTTEVYTVSQIAD